MDIFSRREFLERSALLSAAAATLGTASTTLADTKPVAARAVNDKLRVAVVGVHSRGMSHVGGYLGNQDCEITTVCDCDEAVIGNAMKQIESKQGKAPAYEKDIRKVVENKEIDVVSIATPNHWHALMAVWAMQNGKDVYVEKPATHNVHEGAIMLATARKYNRICQVGTQSRSNPGMREAIAFAQSGKIGKVELAIALCYKKRDSIGDAGLKMGEQKPPASMDYNLWCGPSPLTMPKRNSKANGTVHYDWHWIWNTGNGDLGNQGVHEMDKARWGLGKNTLPTNVSCLGGRFGYVDDGETANTQLALFDYQDAKLIFEVRGLKTEAYKGVGVGNIWIGSEGSVVCPSYNSGVAYDKDGKKITQFSGGKDQLHFDNFVKAVRSRKHEELNADISEGHLSAALCHLANISYRTGSEGVIGKDAVATDNKTMNEFFATMIDHLKSNKVSTDQAIGRAGSIVVDPKTETIKSCSNGATLAQANAMLFREYRKGFELKEVV
jgi:predicted dehydrogenase